MKKTAVVTGASRGIGKEIALQLARAGFDIAMIYVGSEELATATINELKSTGVKASAYYCDVSKFDEVKNTADKIVADFGSVDVLVNNAGITRDKLAIQMAEDEFDSVIAVNLKGVFNCSKHFMRSIMKSACGRIINIASVSGITGNAGQANYSASKAGVIGLTKTFAKELAGKGTTVNAIAPGFIDTDMTANLPDSVKEYVKTAVPLKRMGTIEEVASMAVFLASSAASYVTGQVLVVDGGLTM